MFYKESLGCYVLRLMLVGVYLIMSIVVGIVVVDIIGKIFFVLLGFVFVFIFSFGFIYVLIFNGELVIFNMFYFIVGVYNKNIFWKKVIIILIYCIFFNFVGVCILVWLFN